MNILTAHLNGYKTLFESKVKTLDTNFSQIVSRLIGEKGNHWSNFNHLTKFCLLNHPFKVSIDSDEWSGSVDQKKAWFCRKSSWHLIFIEGFIFASPINTKKFVWIGNCSSDSVPHILYSLVIVQKPICQHLSNACMAYFKHLHFKDMKTQSDGTFV